MEELTHLTNHENLPLSSNQKRLWLISQQNKPNPAYNIQLAYHLEGEIDAEVLRSSLEHLFEQQHTLFSVFRQKGGIPYIRIIPRPVILKFVDFSGFTLQSGREKSMSFAGEQSRIPFNIEEGPLYRLFLIKEAEQSYYFCAIIHHLIFDGFSRRLFVQQLSRNYTNLIRGVNEEDKPIKFYSYDFAALENGVAVPENEKQHVEFWKENLKDCPPELKFPYDFLRSNNPTGFGSKETFIISSENSNKLRALSSESNTSVFKILLSILGILFNKSTGESDICIGIPVSVRRSSHSFKILGFFVDTLPVRLMINETGSFRNHISYSGDIVNKTILYSLPFDQIVGLLKPERIPGLSPFFQISFSWINNFTIPLNLGGITGKRVTVPNGVAPSDITFYMWENGHSIEGEIEYNTDLIKKETIIRLRDNLMTLVNNLLQNPDAAIDSVQMISEEERKLIESFNDTQSDYPREKTITQLFEEQAKIYPDKTAIVFKESTLTYKQLNEKANQLSRHLRDLGVTANIPVALLSDKSVELFIGIIGILKAGGCYTPVDSEYPLQRIRFILKDSGCKILLTQNRLMDMDLNGITKLNLNNPELFTGESSNPEKSNDSTDLAYILYTSGTTGVPKGTPIPQRGVVRMVRNTNYINFNAEDRVLQAGAIVFDASALEIWGALLNGGTLHIIDKSTLLNVKALGDVIVNNKISIVTLTSAFFTQIAEAHTDIFNKVKYLLVGGDVLSAFHVNKVRKDNPELIVINAYGPTENSCMSTAYRVDRDFDINIPIGRPVSNSPAYIFDKRLNYQPIGIIGELYVGGDGLSKGYLNREDLNRICFIDNPHNPGERIYKTGDRARWLSDGNIEFHGRLDNQLKIRGFRIELDEIESVISEIDEVVETVIKPVKVQEGDYKLIAFLNVTNAFSMDINEIGMVVKAKLPEYMVPSAYKFMHGFPKTINGKIDKKALSYNESEFEIKERKEERVLSPTEKTLLNIWCDTLKTKNILTTDNFFNIGGNSLLAVNVFSKIMSEFKLDLDLRIFFDSPRIKDLAETIDISLNADLDKDSFIKPDNMGPGIITGEI